jgi:hypothetical protein
MLKEVSFFAVILVIIKFCIGRCPNYCSGHGKCGADATCICEDGWGSVDDTTDIRQNDCSLRVCRYGKSWGTVLSYGASFHSVDAECSGIGICDRQVGKCNCPKGYSGAACEKRKCPNDCSGHGRCVSMKNMAMLDDALPLYSSNVSYGSVSLNVSHQLMQSINAFLNVSLVYKRLGC